MEVGVRHPRFLLISVRVWSARQSAREKVTPDNDLWAKRKQTLNLFLLLDNR